MALNGTILLFFFAFFLFFYFILLHICFLIYLSIYMDVFMSNNLLTFSRTVCSMQVLGI